MLRTRRPRAKLHLLADGDGLLELHHHEADAGITAGDEPHVWAGRLLDRLRDYLPTATDARVSRWTVATRPIPADKRTSAGLLSSLPGYAEIVTHSAITMGALLPHLVAEEITSGTVSPLLASFRPERASSKPALSERGS